MMLNTTYDKSFIQTIKDHIKKNNPEYNIEYIHHVLKDTCKSFIRQSLDTLSRETITQEIINEYKKEFDHLLQEYYNTHLELEAHYTSLYGKKNETDKI